MAGENFGCGSSRESTLRALKQAGVVGVAAGSTSHIFRRNAINLGIPVVILQGSTEGLRHRDSLELDLDAGLLRSESEGIPVDRPDGYEQHILRAGGLAAALRTGVWPPEEEA
ncbi:MAG: hypothetical protein ISR64_06015 [Deltaproteobacteria bacterium]|nr:hypothetical protein [Deltaproteobacteria bacterium]